MFLFCINAMGGELAPKPKVTLVLAGGGAKGFAHLAVLRRLEKDHIPISKIIGTSMGAVIGSLYAAGMSTNEIENVLGGIDVSEVALDMVDRLELSNRARAYQQQYPIGLNFGLNDGQISIARGLSDGQRFLALLQKLTSHVPSEIDFDKLKIPFRAVATRSDTGELKVFRVGSLPLAVRASMAAPGVFAPIEIGGETYLDGGLVSNLPVEVAIDEGAEIIVASFLKSTDETIQKRKTDNAFTLADRMLDILIKQNERRNLKLLRPQDVLISTHLPDIEFTDFNRYPEIIKAGEASIRQMHGEFEKLAMLVSVGDKFQQTLSSPASERIIISSIQIEGLKNVSNDSIQKKFSQVIGTEFDPVVIDTIIENLYLSEDFEKIYYALVEQSDKRYVVHLQINEKIYSPNYFKTSMGMYSEQSGTNLFSLGVGWRRPWLNETGLEGRVDIRIGTDEELTGKLIQPTADRWSIYGLASHRKMIRPFYPTASKGNKKITDLSVVSDQFRLGLEYEVSKKVNVEWSAATNKLNAEATNVLVANSFRSEYISSRLELTIDQLDSPIFSTGGYYAKVLHEEGISGSKYKSSRVNLKWAGHIRSHILNFGVNVGKDRISSDCPTCINPNLLYLGGFQAMGAFAFGQLMGDDLRHFQTTYAYQLSDGGLFRQKTQVGLVLEVGDAWTIPNAYQAKRSQTAFVGIDSKIGNIYLGVAQGSQNMKNIFLQLGRPFGY
jgi:NTE family protein